MEKKEIRNAQELHNMFDSFINDDNKGVIALTEPVLNINEWKGNGPSLYSLLLDISNEEFEKIAYFSSMVVTDSEEEGYEPGKILDNDGFQKYEALPANDKEKITLASGAAAIEFLLRKVDLNEKYEAARRAEIECMKTLEALWEKRDMLDADALNESILEKYSGIVLDEDRNADVDLSEEEQCLEDIDAAIDEEDRKLGEIRCMLSAIHRVEGKELKDLIIREIVLFPLELRGIIKEVADDTPYATYDIERLYRRALNRNSRVEKLKKIGAPEIILRNEKRMLQESIDCLIANGKRGKLFAGTREDERCAYASLTDLVLKQVKLV